MKEAVFVALRWKLRGSSAEPQMASYVVRSCVIVNSGPQNDVARGEYSILERARFDSVREDTRVVEGEG